MPSHSPARSVAPSTCDGGARKVRKIDKELAKYQIEASKVDRDKKLEAIYDRFKNDPEAIESTYTMLLLERKERGAVVDDDTPFSCKCVTMWKVPKTFLVHWIPGISRLKESMLAEAAKKNPTVLQEAMCRSLVIDPTHFCGPIDRSAWKLAMESRHAESGCKFVTLVLTDGRFDWDRCGLFILHPPLLPESDPNEHTYKSIKFEGIEVKIDSGLVVIGTARIALSWSYSKATLMRPATSPRSCLAPTFSQRRSGTST